MSRHEHAEAETSAPEAVPDASVSARVSDAEARGGFGVQQVLALQRLAGNRATRAALARQVATSRSPRAVQRQEPMLPPEALPRFMPPEGFIPRVAPRVTPIPRVGPIPEMPIPRVGPIPEMPIPRVGPTPGPAPGPTPGPGPLRPPMPFTGPLPDTEPAPQPNPNVKPQPSPQETEEEDKKKKGCGTKTLPHTVVTYDTGPLGQGKRVKASPLTRCPPAEGPGTLPADWIYKPQFECLARNGQGDYWVRMHLLHGKTSSAKIRNLHGPGDKMKNLIIGDKWVNQQMNRDVEGKVIPQVYDQDAVLWYETNVDDYIKDNEYFVRKFTVRWGRYDTATGTEGPAADTWVYAATKWPPACPPSMGAGVPPVAPPATPSTPSAPPAAAGQKAFDSTFDICYRVLNSRAFNVPKGGVRVTLRGNWGRRFADSDTECPTDGYEVTLKKKGLIFDDDVSTAKVPVGGQSVEWEQLPPGDYYLMFEAPGHSPFCCLKGDIGVTTFDAPAPMPIDPNMMA